MTPAHGAPAPRIFLIRHGETAWSKSGQHTGLTDMPLTPAGETAALGLRDRLAAIEFARVFTSPLQRARRTCELAGLGGHAVIEPDLVEWDYGPYEGLTSAEIRQRQPDWDLFNTGIPNVDCNCGHVPGQGETPAVVAARAKRFLDKAAALEGDTAVFSSGHFIRVLAATWLNLPPTNAKCFYTATASVGTLGYEHGRADRVILLWNDVRP
ncbi:MAG: putative phosphoglycerate mutase family protein [Phycisphaerales bacterium]|nr:putative phosphoglycerate mutase family protein [Phycisphaerales bacterium]